MAALQLLTALSLPVAAPQPDRECTSNTERSPVPQGPREWARGCVRGGLGGEGKAEPQRAVGTAPLPGQWDGPERLELRDTALPQRWGWVLLGGGWAQRSSWVPSDLGYSVIIHSKRLW